MFIYAIQIDGAISPFDYYSSRNAAQIQINMYDYKYGLDYAVLVPIRVAHYH
jgi:hypothetical protein